MLGAPTCNPSYSRGRDQEDRSSKPALANSSRDPISEKKKKKISKTGWWSDSKCDPEFKPQYLKRERERERDPLHTKR
jgi:hypothetical protein